MKKSVVKELKHPYISINPEVSKGSPVISGTRVRVIDIAIEYDRLGLTPDQIIDAHPHLCLEAIHDALSYYYENRDAFDEELRERKETIKKMAQSKPSILGKTVG
jgi:uncharacterized protein (DUF433 family)